jgi:hypothetical protein
MKNDDYTKLNPEQPDDFAYTVSVKLEQEGPEVTRELITPKDMHELYNEAWLSHLRDGNPDLQFSDLCLRLLPVYKKGLNDRCKGLLVESFRPGRKKRLHLFGIQAVSHVAERAAKRLLKDKTMTAGENYFYEVLAEEGAKEPSFSQDPEPLIEGRFTVNRKPLIYKSVPLPPLLEKARPIGKVDDWLPIIYSSGSFLKAERLARRGADCDPPEETGAVLLGSLCSCPDTGEFFVIVSDVIELLDTEQTSFSLYYSGKTWARIQALVKARQSNPETRTERIVGQCHGHNFLPSQRIDNEQECESCDKRDSCEMTSVFVSTNDLQWTRSVFSQQPWAFCHIFGLNTRNEPVHSQYGLQGGRLVNRGFYVLPELEAALADVTGHISEAEIIPDKKEDW